jgi:hypothetical protein
MPEKSLHIVSFDIPFPPKYGGAIEVFYKIKALHDNGYKIYLHCFVNSIPTENPELKSLVSGLYFYKNTYNPLYFFSKIPFSVISRNDKSLLKNLQKNDAPILFEGLKTAYLSHEKSLKNRIKILRLHNLEQDYFLGIAKSENNWIKKILYFLESKKYQIHEKKLKTFDRILALSKFENDYTNLKFGNSSYIPVFHGNETVELLEGFGKYALYHGDLRTSDNRKVAKYLIGVFKEIKDYKLVIASGSYENFIRKNIKDTSNIEFVYLEGFEKLKELLKNAHINIILSFQKSGTKLKLVNSLFRSRFCIINENIIDDEIVSDFCVSIASKEELILKINNLKTQPYTDSKNKKAVLEKYLNDKVNAQKIIEILENLKH